jgi:hypothetical protein
MYVMMTRSRVLVTESSSYVKEDVDLKLVMAQGRMVWWMSSAIEVMYVYIWVKRGSWGILSEKAAINPYPIDRRFFKALVKVHVTQLYINRNMLALA